MVIINAVMVVLRFLSTSLKFSRPFIMRFFPIIKCGQNIDLEYWAVRPKITVKTPISQMCASSILPEFNQGLNSWFWHVNNMRTKLSSRKNKVLIFHLPDRFLLGWSNGHSRGGQSRARRHRPKARVARSILELWPMWPISYHWRRWALPLCTGFWKIFNFTNWLKKEYINSLQKCDRCDYKN